MQGFYIGSKECFIEYFMVAKRVGFFVQEWNSSGAPALPVLGSASGYDAAVELYTHFEKNPHLIEKVLQLMGKYPDLNPYCGNLKTLVVIPPKPPVFLTDVDFRCATFIGNNKEKILDDYMVGNKVVSFTSYWNSYTQGPWLPDFNYGSGLKNAKKLVDYVLDRYHLCTFMVKTFLVKDHAMLPLGIPAREVYQVLGLPSPVEKAKPDYGSYHPVYNPAPVYVPSVNPSVNIEEMINQAVNNTAPRVRKEKFYMTSCENLINHFAKKDMLDLFSEKYKSLHGEELQSYDVGMAGARAWYSEFDCYFTKRGKMVATMKAEPKLIPPQINPLDLDALADR